MRPGLKKSLRWAAIGTGVGLAAFFLWSAYATWSSGRRLERRLDAIRQAGDPLSIADYARTTIPDATNADVVLEQVAAEVEAIEKDLTALYPKSGRPPWPLAPEDRPKLEELYQRHPRAIPLLLEAAGRSDYSHAFDVAMPTSLFSSQILKHSGRHRAAIRVLDAWSMLLLSRGERDDALGAATASLRLSRLWARDPGFISSLVLVYRILTD